MNYSSQKMLEHVAELNCRRIKMVLESGPIYKPLSAYTLEQQAWIRNARQLHARYSLGDYRHEDTEEGQLIELCHWLIAEHKKKTKTPIPDIDFTGMKSKESLRPGIYPQIYEMVRRS